MRAHRIPGVAVLSAAVMTGCALLEPANLTVDEGQCFDTNADDSEVASIEVKPCDEEHVYEAYAVFDYPAESGDEYPGDEEMSNYADEECRGNFADYVGLEYDSSMWYSTSITPSSDTWGSGDREIICALHGDDVSAVTGSARNSNE